MVEGKIVSFDGVELHYYLAECDNPKYIVQIAHGMQEYSQTYFEFAEFLNKHNCIVFMFDERCHGKTAQSIDKLGQTKTDMFSETVKDHLFITKMLDEKYHLPIIFFGHSYGSFIGQAYLQQNTIAKKIILSGSCYMKTAEVFLGKIITGIQRIFVGRNKPAKLIESMSLKKYPKYFHDNACWITSDEEKTKDFYAQKYNGTVFPINFYYYMFKNQLKLYNKKSLSSINKGLSIMLISGKNDPVGKFCKGISRLNDKYKKYGLNTTFKLYKNMRHGLIQEKDRKMVFNDIINFIKN